MKNNYALFLDDLRVPKDVTWIDLPLVNWEVVRNFKQFVNYVKSHGIPARVSFDFDLEPEHYVYDWSSNSAGLITGTGQDCVKWLVAHCEDAGEPFPEYTLHTLNRVGLENMKSYIESYKKAKL